MEAVGLFLRFCGGSHDEKSRRLTSIKIKQRGGQYRAAP
jgi:hypothetical protein